MSMQRETRKSAKAAARQYWDDIQFAPDADHIIDTRPILDYAASVVHERPVFAAELILYTAERLGAITAHVPQQPPAPKKAESVQPTPETVSISALVLDETDKARLALALKKMPVEDEYALHGLLTMYMVHTDLNRVMLMGGTFSDHDAMILCSLYLGLKFVHAPDHLQRRNQSTHDPVGRHILANIDDRRDILRVYLHDLAKRRATRHRMTNELGNKRHILRIQLPQAQIASVCAMLRRYLAREVLNMTAAERDLLLVVDRLYNLNLSPRIINTLGRARVNHMVKFIIRPIPNVIPENQNAVYQFLVDHGATPL